MNGTPPEANNEYSRAPATSRWLLPTFRSADSAGFWYRATDLRRAVLLCTLLACGLLIVAEFTPLFHVQVATRPVPARTVRTGAHHGYALVPIALLAGLMAFAAYRGAGRGSLAAIGVLGIVALVIVLVGDLPDARARGLVASPGGGYDLGSATPSAGLYLETLGAILLLIVSGLALLRRGVENT